MLEQLVEQLWEQENIQLDLKAKQAAKLAPLVQQANAIREHYQTGLDASASRIPELKKQILGEMTETTHHLQHADITKKSKKTLVITDDVALLEHLQKTAQTTAEKVKITYNFNPCKLIKAVENKDVKLPPEIAHIDEDFTLAVKKN